MAIIYNKQQRTITLHTKSSTYQMLIGKYGFLLHLYYGTHIHGSAEYLLTYYDRGFSGNPYAALEDRTFSLDALPQEYPCLGNGDFRTPSLIIENSDGTLSCDLRYVSHEIYSGKYTLEGLPSVYANKEEAQTLEVLLEDAVTNVKITLLYGVLEEQNIITRSVRIENLGRSKITLKKVHSACLDWMHGNYDMIHFHGRHGMERMQERTPVFHGVKSIGSRRGTSSHQQSPFVILTQQHTTETFGECYGMSFVYSGGFKSEVEGDQYEQTRWSMGIQDEHFSYPLETGESFTAPEAILSFSETGFGQLSRNYHEVLRNHICRGAYKTTPRPVLINNWEATYFDFTGDKIYEIGKQASALGVEMLVLDDGWFGKRDSDNSGLGDWHVNEEKMGGTLQSVVKKINDLGLKFGLWIEPEMVSEDSELYQKHPEWTLVLPCRNPVRARSQLVLDFSRKEVVDYIFGQISSILDSCNIEYIKMDMNRSICDVYSAVVDSEHQGTILHQYILGVYDFMERINQRYSHLFIEGCSGGGGRFDAGMLYYTPQIWCSDNTDAIERLYIQHGTSFGFPISAVGSHVSKSPNEQTGRQASLHTRGVVAMAGSFGYELDLNTLTTEEKEMVKQQIIDYHKYWDLFHNGDYYRITNPHENSELAAWEFVAKDKSEALMNVVTLNTHCNGQVHYVYFQGLDPSACYNVNGVSIYGDALMHGGLPVPRFVDEYQAWQVHIRKNK